MRSSFLGKSKMKTKVWTVEAMDYYKTPELILSDYEKGYLTAIYDELASVEAKEELDDAPDSNFWYMVVVGDRTFDLGIWLTDEDDINSEQVCVVHECHDYRGDGSYSTDVSLQYYLKGASDADL